MLAARPATSVRMHSVELHAPTQVRHRLSRELSRIPLLVGHLCTSTQRRCTHQMKLHSAPNDNCDVNATERIDRSKASAERSMTESAHRNASVIAKELSNDARLLASQTLLVKFDTQRQKKSLCRQCPSHTSRPSIVFQNFMSSFRAVCVQTNKEQRPNNGP